MCRDAQLAMAAVGMLLEHTQLAAGQADPDRIGVVLGSDIIRGDFDDVVPSFRACMPTGEMDTDLWGEHGVSASYPLTMLKSLPNMTACHVSIVHDARGPNNTLYQGDCSALLSIGEASRVIERGAADLMIAGGASSRIKPYDWSRFCVYDRLSPSSAPAQSLQPFDLHRHGTVRGEAAGLLMLESSDHALARQAPILARVLGFGSGFRSPQPDLHGGLDRSIRMALADAQLQPADIDLIICHGQGDIDLDRQEAGTLHAMFPTTPVTALKGAWGLLSGASGSLEAIAAVLALQSQQAPVTLHHHTSDPACPIALHLPPRPLSLRHILISSLTHAGQAASLILGLPE